MIRDTNSLDIWYLHNSNKPKRDAPTNEQILNGMSNLKFVCKCVVRMEEIRSTTDHVYWAIKRFAFKFWIDNLSLWMSISRRLENGVANDSYFGIIDFSTRQIVFEMWTYRQCLNSGSFFIIAIYLLQTNYQLQRIFSFFFFICLMGKVYQSQMNFVGVQNYQIFKEPFKSLKYQQERITETFNWK